MKESLTDVEELKSGETVCSAPSSVCPPVHSLNQFIWANCLKEVKHLQQHLNDDSIIFFHRMKLPLTLKQVGLPVGVKEESTALHQ